MMHVFAEVTTGGWWKEYVSLLHDLPSPQAPKPNRSRHLRCAIVDRMSNDGKSYLPIECQLCHKEFRFITHTHLKNFHDGMTSAEYRANYGEVKTTPITLIDPSTTCPKGHPWTEENTSIHKNKEGGIKDERQCRTCHKKTMKRRRERLARKWKGDDPYAEHPTGTKTCARCHKVLPVAYFTISRNQKDGLYHQCRTCSSEKLQLRLYGRFITKEDSCEICGSSERLTVDHCHKTDKTRGILCTPHNQMLGFGQDDPIILQRAIDYLRRSGDVPT